MKYFDDSDTESTNPTSGDILEHCPFSQLMNSTETPSAVPIETSPDAGHAFHHNTTTGTRQDANQYLWCIISLYNAIYSVYIIFIADRYRLNIVPTAPRGRIVPSLSRNSSLQALELEKATKTLEGEDRPSQTSIAGIPFRRPLAEIRKDREPALLPGQKVLVHRRSDDLEDGHASLIQQLADIHAAADGQHDRDTQLDQKFRDDHAGGIRMRGQRIPMERPHAALDDQKSIAAGERRRDGRSGSIHRHGDSNRLSARNGGHIRFRHLSRRLWLFLQQESATFDLQLLALHQAYGQFPPRPGIDALHRSPGHLHHARAFFLGKPFVVDQTDRLVFIHRHDHGQRSCPVGGNERGMGRQRMNSFPFLRSCHSDTVVPNPAIVNETQPTDTGPVIVGDRKPGSRPILRTTPCPIHTPSRRRHIFHHRSPTDFVRRTNYRGELLPPCTEDNNSPMPRSKLTANFPVQAPYSSVTLGRSPSNEPRTISAEILDQTYTSCSHA